MTTTNVIDELEGLLKEAMTEVFTTMLSLPIEVEEPTDFPADTPLVAASVGFIGEATGVVYIYNTDAFARRVTSRMLGMPEAEIDGHEMVNDAMGELGNMIVGQIKSRLCDRGLSCVLTIPSIVRGQKFSVEPVASTTSRKTGFQSEGNPLRVEILVKTTD
jgi:chemotaxis protein CheX